MLPGSDGPVADVHAAQDAADSAGFPVLLKAAAGGGGRGMRLVTGRAGARRSAYDVAQREAEAAFGDGSLYVEKLLRRRPPRRGPDPGRRPGRRAGLRATASAPSSAVTRS